MLVVALVRKTGSIFGYGEDEAGAIPGALVADRDPSVVPEEVLQFEAKAKPGLGAHGQAVHLSDQSENDIQDQLKASWNIFD